jgi:hypothetical protein
MGQKLPGNMDFIRSWARDHYGPGAVHLGRSVLDPAAETFVFQDWCFPVDLPNEGTNS